MRIESLRSSLAYFPDLDGYWRPENLPATESKIRELLEAEPSRSVELLIQLARVRGLQGDLAAARTHLEDAQNKMSDVPLESPLRLRYLLEHGRILSLSMSPRKAEPIFLQAWELAQQLRQDFFAIDAAVMLSIILPSKSQNIWFQRAQQLAQQSSSPEAKQWLGQLHLMAGWQNFDVRRYEEALANFEEAIAKTDTDEKAAKLFPMLWGKARVMRALGRTSEALDMQTALLDRMQTLGPIDGHVYLELAECNQLMKKHEQARMYFELAHTALSADGWYVDNRSDELERMKYIFKKRN